MSDIKERLTVIVSEAMGDSVAYSRCTGLVRKPEDYADDIIAELEKERPLEDWNKTTGSMLMDH